MKVFWERLDWGMGTKDPQSDPADKAFLGLCSVSNVSNWSNFLLKIRLKILSLARVLTSKQKKCLCLRIKFS